jgi:hypothetical protein
VAVARGAQRAGGCPEPGDGVIQLRTDGIAVTSALPGGDEHVSVGQQRRGVFTAGGVQCAGCGPGCGCWIIQLCAGDVVGVIAPRDQHLPARQQGRCVLETWDVHRSGGREQPCVSGRNGAQADRKQESGGYMSCFHGFVLPCGSSHLAGAARARCSWFGCGRVFIGLRITGPRAGRTAGRRRSGSYKGWWRPERL